MSSSPEQIAAAEAMSIACYENEVPPFVEAALDRLHGNIFSSLAHFRVYGDIENIDTYAVREGGEVVTLFLFRRKNRTVEVINEGIKIDEDAVTRFANYIFARYSAINSISFHAVENRIERLPMPYQYFNLLEDIVLKMPRTAEQYRAQLGKATRRYINRYLNKLKRSFPSFCYEIYAKEKIQPWQIRDIIQLNKTRMADKNIRAGIGEAEAQHITQLAQSCGLVGIIKIDGEICAGTINFNAGKNYFLETIAHDPRYNEFGLGTLCCYLTICECIGRGGDEYHFLWGQYDYKSRLQGVQRDLDHLVIYRSYPHILLNGPMVFRNAFRHYARAVKLWLREIEQKNGVGSSLVVRLRGFVHYVKNIRTHRVDAGQTH